MNKYQFLAALRERLDGASSEDIKKSLDYYEEMINDRIEDGMSEEEAVSALGSIDDIVAQIKSEIPVQRSARVSREDKGAPRKMRTWEKVMLILGSPVWLALLVAAVITVLSVYIVIWAVLVVFYAADLCFAAAALVGVIGAFSLAMLGMNAQALIFFGVGLVCAGMCVLWFLGTSKLALCTVKLTKAAVRLISGRRK